MLVFGPLSAAVEVFVPPSRCLVVDRLLASDVSALVLLLNF